MNSAEFTASIHELYARLLSLTASKGEEYKGTDDSQFANFERGARENGITREQVLMVYLSKHLDSIRTYINDRATGKQRQYAEPISGRIDDAILYLLLLRGMTVENDTLDRAAGDRHHWLLDPARAYDATDGKSTEACRARFDNIESYRGVRVVPMAELKPLVTEVAVCEHGIPLRYYLQCLECVQRDINEGGLVASMAEQIDLKSEMVGELVAIVDGREFKGEAALAALYSFLSVVNNTDAIEQMHEPTAVEFPFVEPSAENTHQPLPTKRGPTVILGADQREVQHECRMRGLACAESALSNADQLHNASPGTHVIVIHHGSRSDDWLCDQVRERAERHQITWEILAR